MRLWLGFRGSYQPRPNCLYCLCRKEAWVAKLPIVIPPTIPVYHQEVRTLFRLDQSLAVFPRRLGFHRLRYLFNNSYTTNVLLRLAAIRTTIPLRLARVVRRVELG
ncbi:BQ5605_C008g04990 [Microbotryum silenes-dioicae]|uniref:BQ5605_C008g04990 protein n=1 Tax=Microbotryum silenes-dioicae TaxID=796604 RepID=A0A2X0MG03_9BASI|nr:BQ5605_C008g04990 [Microbotryum silenes-dioicae]